MAGDEKRRHPRYSVDKAVRAVSRGRVRKGRVTDISASGAAIQSDEPFDSTDPVDLEIEDMKDVSGKVARTLDDGFAVEFELDEDSQDDLLNELSQIDRSIRDEQY